MNKGNNTIIDILFEWIYVFFMIQVIFVLLLIGEDIYSGMKESGKRNTETETALLSRDVGKPYSDWEKSPTGSAKYLDGTTVFVSIFLEDTEADWTPADRYLVQKNMNIAADYLKEEGKRYGKQVELIYDTNEHPDLEFHMKYGQPFVEEDAGDAYTDMVLAVYEYIHDEIPVRDIMKEYQVNSIGFLCFADHTASQALTYHYGTEIDSYFYPEISFINLRWESSGENVNPTTYAHEILHLFGARDFYLSSERYGITQEIVDYVVENYETEIMLGYSAAGVDEKDRISLDITKLTAYYLGWLSYITELDRFPTMTEKNPACFTMQKDSEGKEVYQAASRLKLEGSIRQDLYFAACGIFIVIQGIFTMRKLNRIRKRQLKYN